MIAGYSRLWYVFFIDSEDLETNPSIITHFFLGHCRMVRALVSTLHMYVTDIEFSGYLGSAN